MAAFAFDLGAGCVALGAGGGVGGSEFADLLAKFVELAACGVDLVASGGGCLLGPVRASGLGRGALDGCPGALVGLGPRGLCLVELLGEVVALSLEDCDALFEASPEQFVPVPHRLGAEPFPNRYPTGGYNPANVLIESATSV